MRTHAPRWCPYCPTNEYHNPDACSYKPQEVPMSVKASQISFNEGIMRLAVIHNKQIEFRYEKAPDAPIETRRLIPNSIIESRTGSMSFFGYDPDREAERQFRVDRIKGDVRIV